MLKRLPMVPGVNSRPSWVEFKGKGRNTKLVNLVGTFSGYIACSRASIPTLLWGEEQEGTWTVPLKWNEEYQAYYPFWMKFDSPPELITIRYIFLKMWTHLNWYDDWIHDNSFSLEVIASPYVVAACCQPLNKYIRLWGDYEHSIRLKKLLGIV